MVLGIQREQGLTYTGLSSVALILGLLGCNAQLQIPDQVAITCSRSADCPSGLSCNTELGRCIPGRAEDTRAPTAQNALVVPGSVQSGTPFRLSFDVDEALLDPPAISLGVSEPGTFQLDPSASSDTHFEFDYAPTGVEAPEGVAQITARLVDRAGNVAPSARVGELTIDNTPPQTVAASVSPNVVGAGGLLVVTVNLNEAPTRLNLSSDPPLSLGEPVQFGLSFSWTVPVGDGAMEGPYLFSLDAEDSAGNQSTGLAIGQATVDTTPPELTRLELGRDRVSLVPGFNTAAILVETPDDLDAQGGSFQLDVGGEEVNACERSGDGPFVYTCTYALSGTEPEGLQAVVASLRDGADNVRFASSRLEIDYSPPVTFSSQLLRDDNNLIANSAPDEVFLSRRRIDGLPGMPDLFVTLTVDEGLSAIPQLALAGSSGTFTPAASNPVPGPGATSFAFTFSQDGTETDGSYTLEATVVDVVGNLGTVEVGTIHFDNTGPSLSGSLADSVIYQRAPWGTENSPLASFGIVVEAGAAGEGDVVVVYDGASPSTDTEIGVIPVPDSGSNRGLLFPAIDRENVWLGLRDRAGNPQTGPPDSSVAARRHEWRATLGGKVPGSTVENPHVLVASHWLSGTIVQDSTDSAEPSLAELDTVAVVGSSGLTVSVEADPPPKWVFLPNSNAISDGSDGAFEPTLGQGLHTRNDTSYVWDGSAWTSLGSSGIVAGPNDSVIVAQDEARGELVAFVSQVSLVTGTSETWTFDADTRTWTARSPAGPGPRMDAAMAYDAVRQEVVLFGGLVSVTGNFSSGFEYNKSAQTWVWNGTTWTLRSPPTSPPARSNHSMAYDASRDRVILFGGQTGLGTPMDGRNDVWEWDGSTWEQRCTTSPCDQDVPDARFDANLTYDASKQLMVLLGGATFPVSCGAVPSNEVFNDSWVWTGDAWLGAAVEGTPAGRSARSQFYDPLRERIVSAGGAPGCTLGGEEPATTWELPPLSSRRPGLIASFRLAGDIDPATIDRFEVRAIAGGSGNDGNGPVNGARIAHWNTVGMSPSSADDWVPLVENTAAQDGPRELLSVQDIADEAAALRWLGDNDTIVLQLDPAAETGPALGELFLDYLELRVRYERP